MNITQTASGDLDYLAARLHARRSRMAEGPRLDEWCRLQSVPELGRAIYPGSDFAAARTLQRELTENLAREIAKCLGHLNRNGRKLIQWLLARLQLENIKTLLRGFLNQTPLETIQARLVSLPADLALPINDLLSSKTLADFATSLPEGQSRDRLLAIVSESDLSPSALLLEAALDCGYFQELFLRHRRLPSEERDFLQPMLDHEVNFFQFVLAVRGKFHHQLAREKLLPFRLAEGNAPRNWFPQLLAVPDISAAAKLGSGVILDELPAKTPTAASDLETLAWNRFLRLANRAMRRSHMGIAAVAGYFAIRRIEIANLTTLSEGIRLGVAEEKLRARMIPRNELEVANV